MWCPQCLFRGRLLNGSNFSEEKQSRHLRTDLNADGSR
jgi:hypothetical protein